ncbi:UDP-N-acetylmuramate dehydrogenase [Parapedobacter lycopersici]|uniref:UDP-N-acetylmuramate dehydrogenase n=1 Tax=Parapedobacter lycopersici TaxID=1864939 RepID=UPI00214DD5F1|nr:UDP-N-acetylmuramate dehydrogenase [Parapedobacter lycopersici]
MRLLIQENFPLKSYNTFGVDARARYFVEINDEAELKQLYTQHEDLLRLPVLILGGGSNILFTRDVDGLVIHMAIQGIDHRITGTSVEVVAGGGVIWNDLVWYCVDRRFGGIENLVLIPGTAGAAPVQNIGAYGAELSGVFRQCRAFDTHTGEMITFSREECGFSYRDSRFKREKGRYIITQLSLNLTLTPALNTGYGAVRSALESRGIHEPTLSDVAEAISSIRTEKLPDPATIGNAGSFFKNPVITVQHLGQLQTAFPHLDFVYFPANKDHVKIAGGWLIEQCGWKGKQVGDAGTWKNQALVLVNHKNASGLDIYNLSTQIIDDVKETFGILLEREVNVV